MERLRLKTCPALDQVNTSTYLASQDNRPIILGLSGDVKKKTEIGTIPSWGPQFRVSFDLKINSQVSGDRGGFASVLSFKGNGGKNNGRRIPDILMNKKGFLHFTSAVNGNRNYNFNINSIKLNKWYSIAIEQIRDEGKVRETEKLHK